MNNPRTETMVTRQHKYLTGARAVLPDHDASDDSFD
jgi:hypothetical protein